MTSRNEVVAGDRMAYSGFVMLAGAILLVLFALGYLPTWHWVGRAALPAMLVGGFSSLVASLIGALPLLWVRGRPPIEKISAVMGSIALRLLVVVLLAASAYASALVARRALLVWVVSSHVGLLVIDTLFARAELRADDPSARNQRPAASARTSD